MKIKYNNIFIYVHTQDDFEFINKGNEHINFLIKTNKKFIIKFIINKSKYYDINQYKYNNRINHRFVKNILNNGIFATLFNTNELKYYANMNCPKMENVIKEMNLKNNYNISRLTGFKIDRNFLNDTENIIELKLKCDILFFVNDTFIPKINLKNRNAYDFTKIWVDDITPDGIYNEITNMWKNNSKYIKIYNYNRKTIDYLIRDISVYIKKIDLLGKLKMLIYIFPYNSINIKYIINKNDQIIKKSEYKFVFKFIIVFLNDRYNSSNKRFTFFDYVDAYKNHLRSLGIAYNKNIINKFIKISYLVSYTIRDVSIFFKYSTTNNSGQIIKHKIVDYDLKKEFKFKEILRNEIALINAFF